MAVQHALAAWQTYDRLGSPEGRLGYRSTGSVGDRAEVQRGLRRI